MTTTHVHLLSYPGEFGMVPDPIASCGEAQALDDLVSAWGVAGGVYEATLVEQPDGTWRREDWTDKVEREIRDTAAAIRDAERERVRETQHYHRSVL